MIISIGEIVWDIFKDKQVLGGAPLNVAYHLASLGKQVALFSRVGDDQLGRTALESIQRLGLATSAIQTDPALPTGRVTITLSPDGEPHFTIVAPAAWDEIDAALFDRSVLAEPFFLVFGTLAQRAPGSRQAIRFLWDKAKLRFYDVNLRPPFTDRQHVLDSLQAADVVKLNADELAAVADWSHLAAGSITQRAQGLCRHWNLHALAVTMGEHGAYLMSRDQCISHPGFPVTVEDSVGAGDAFFATLIEGIIANRPWPTCLARANKRGAFVASKAGATPSMNDFSF